MLDRYNLINFKIFLFASFLFLISLCQFFNERFHSQRSRSIEWSNLKIFFHCLIFFWVVSSIRATFRFIFIKFILLCFNILRRKSLSINGMFPMWKWIYSRSPGFISCGIMIQLLWWILRIWFLRRQSQLFRFVSPLIVSLSMNNILIDDLFFLFLF